MLIPGTRYKIESDSLNVTLFYKQTQRKGSTVQGWRPLAYFYSPKDALKYLIELEVMETGLKDMKTVVEKIDELFRLVNALKGLPEVLRAT